HLLLLMMVMMARRTPRTVTILTIGYSGRLVERRLGQGYRLLALADAHALALGNGARAIPWERLLEPCRLFCLRGLDAAQEPCRFFYLRGFASVQVIKRAT